MKIIFVLNNSNHPRCLKRINEFIDNGYSVKVYGFDRNDGVRNNPRFDIEIIGKMQNEAYYSRLSTLRKGIKHVLNETDNQDILYFFGLDLAIFAKFMGSKRRYIYEESDLRHTYISNTYIRNIIEKIDKNFIKKSLISVFTSEGFIKFHYGDTHPANVVTIPNRLDKSVRDCSDVPSKDLYLSHLSIGFVGGVRYKSVMSFASIFIKEYPQHDFHFFGKIQTEEAGKICEELESYKNCYIHGPYTSPVDLPSIYSQIDLVLSTYDVDYLNVIYAEPNKLYESIYFETPIIVSEGTFLADKVESLNSGFAIDAMSVNSVKHFVDGLTKDAILNKKDSIKRLGRDFVINDNKEFFSRLKELI